MLTQTDLLVSHDLKFGGAKRLRLEAERAQRLQPEDRASHLRQPEPSAPAPARRSTWRSTDLAQGYDYNALLAARPDGANARDPRYGMEDLFNPGLQARFSVRFLF